MRLESLLTRLLDIEVPICQAGMGAIAYHELPAAVSAAGGLGAFGGIDMTVEELDEGIRAARALADRPLRVGLGFPMRAPARVDQVAVREVAEPIRQLETEVAAHGVPIEPVPEQAITTDALERALGTLKVDA